MLVDYILRPVPKFRAFRVETVAERFSLTKNCTVEPFYVMRGGGDAVSQKFASACPATVSHHLGDEVFVCVLVGGEQVGEDV